MTRERDKEGLGRRVFVGRIEEDGSIKPLVLVLNLVQDGPQEVHTRSGGSGRRRRRVSNNLYV